VPGDKSVMELVKLPKPAPLEVLLSVTVGFSFIFQQTPLAVTDAPPSVATSPPDVATSEAILLIAAIVTIGGVLIASFLQQNIRGNNSPVRSVVLTKDLKFIDLSDLGESIKVNNLIVMEK